MQNDMLKNNIAPWQEKGRWYHIEVESDGTQWTINHDNSDPLDAGAYASNQGYLVPWTDHPNTNIIDTKFIMHSHPSYAFGAGGVTFCPWYGVARDSVRLDVPGHYTGVVDCYVFADVK